MEFKEYDFIRNPVVQNEVFFLKSKCATRGDLEHISGSVCEPKMAANAEMRPGPQIR